MATKKKGAGWFAVSSDNWKTHIVPATLLPGLLAEMEARGSKGEIVQRPIKEAGIDRGGMCYAGRPCEDFRVAGLLLGMACERVGYFAARLEELEPRRFGRRTYYKLHAHWNCVILTPAMRRRLLLQMTVREPAAKQKADAFYAQMEARQATKH